MIEFLQQFFSSSHHLGVLAEHEQRMKTKINDEPLQRTTTIAPSLKESDDIMALTKKYGELYEGMIIETDLHTMLDICPRMRRKQDAYKGLISKLKKKGVTLSFGNNNNAKGI